MTRWLITGAAGMVGTDLQYALSVAEEDFTALSHLDLDLSDEVGVRRAVATSSSDGNRQLRCLDESR